MQIEKCKLQIAEAPDHKLKGVVRLRPDDLCNRFWSLPIEFAVWSKLYRILVSDDELPISCCEAGLHRLGTTKKPVPPKAEVTLPISWGFAFRKCENRVLGCNLQDEETWFQRTD